MAYYWFRGHTCSESETQAVGVNQWMKLVYFFLEKCCGFINGAESVSGSGKSYVDNDVGSEIVTGSTGQFPGTASYEWDFQDTTGTPFSGASPRDYLCVVDTTNAVNNSIFPIKKVYSDTKVQIDFKGDYDNAEYPTATAANLTWYLIPKGYELPSTEDDYWRLESPHASDWAIQMSYNATNRVGLQLAVDGAWTGERKIGDGTGGSGGSFYFQDYGGNRNYVLDVIVESTGKFLFLGEWSAYTTGGSYDYFQQAMVNVITAIDTIDNDYEKVALISCQQSGQGSTHRGNGNDEFGYFRIWNEDERSEITGYLADLATSSASFNITDSPLPVNPKQPIGVRDAGDGERIGKLQNYSGDVLVPDPNVTSRAFSYLGYTTEYITTSPLHCAYDEDIRTAANQHWRGPLALTKTTSKDYLHHGGGLCLPWCGLTYKAHG